MTQTDNVVQLSDYRHTGNGARETLIEILFQNFDGDNLEFADWILGHLWCEGFKVVPLDDEDEVI